MDLYLDTADVAAWRALMPTGLFTGITTNPLLAHRAGLSYPAINWLDMAGLGAELGAKELHVQVYGPADGYADFAAQIYEAGAKAGIDTVVKIPLTEAGIRAAAGVKALGGKILMTACYSAKQMLVARALGADYIAPYFGRMDEAGLPAFEIMSQMWEAAKGGPTRILVASLRSTDQVMELAAAGHDCFTVSPDVARAFLSDKMTDAAAEAFEEAALS